MPFGISHYARRYLNNSAELKESLTSPLLLWDKPLADHLEEAWAGTMSGTAMKAPRAGEPIIFELKKTPGKPNAFSMGVTVGRIDSNDIIIEDASISRFHAYFQQEARGGGWVLVDAESKNGSWIGPLKLTPNQRSRLEDGVKVRFGDIELQFLSADALLELIRKGLGA